MAVYFHTLGQGWGLIRADICPKMAAVATRDRHLYRDYQLPHEFEWGITFISRGMLLQNYSPSALAQGE